MSFRQLRRALLSANKTLLAMDAARAEPLALLGAEIARGGRVTDVELAAAFGCREEDTAKLAERAAFLAKPQIVQGPRGGNKTAFVSFQGVVNYDVEYQPLAVSTKLFARTMAELAADDTIKNIVVLIDSPGGTVTGLPEAADAMLAAREVKSVTAVVDPLAASAAYWVASQATEISVMPSGDVGSIGVRMMHMDCSEAMAQSGIKVTEISSGEFKTEGSPFTPLSDQSRAYFQAESDAIYAQFLKAVARGRGVSVSDVREKFGKGRVINAADAKKLGMVDRLELTDNAMRRLGLLGEVQASGARRAEGEPLASTEAAAPAVPVEAAAPVVPTPADDEDAKRKAAVAADLDRRRRLRDL